MIKRSWRHISNKPQVEQWHNNTPCKVICQPSSACSVYPDLSYALESLGVGADCVHCYRICPSASADLPLFKAILRWPSLRLLHINLMATGSQQMLSHLWSTVCFYSWWALLQLGVRLPCVYFHRLKKSLHHKPGVRWIVAGDVVCGCPSTCRRLHLDGVYSQLAH